MAANKVDAGTRKDTPTNTKAPSLESFQQSIAIFTKDICEQFKILQQENLEMKRMKLEWVCEKRSLNERIKELEANLKDGKATTVENASNDSISTDAVGDADLKFLQEENLKLKKHLEAYRSGAKFSGIQPESYQMSRTSEDVSRHTSSFQNVEPNSQITDVPNSYLAQHGPPPTGEGRGKTASGAPFAIPESMLPDTGESQATPIREMKRMSLDSPKSLSSEGKIDVISTDMMSWLSEHVDIGDWKPLVRKLGLTDNQIEMIIEEHPRKITEQRYQSFLLWKKTCSKMANVPFLLHVVKAQSLHLLHREFCKTFQINLNEKPCKQPSRSTTYPVPSCEFERFMQPFLPKNGFEAFLQDLQQCGRGDCGLNPQDQYVTVAFEQWSSKYYREHGSDDNLTKCQWLWPTIRTFGNKVRQVFKKHVNQGGVVGPALTEDTKIEKLLYSKRTLITELLSLDAAANWKDLLDWLKKEHPTVFEPVNMIKIQLWEKDQVQAAKNVLSMWDTTTKAEVGFLYRWAVEKGRMDIARELE